MFVHLRAFLFIASVCSELGSSFVLRPPHQHQGLATSTAHQPSTTTTTALCAKKKKGNKKNKQQKKGGFEWATSFTQQPYEASQKRDLVAAALASFKGRTGKHLSPEIEGASDIPKVLWESPMAVVIVSQADSNEDAADEDAADNASSSSSAYVEYANIAALETVGLKKNEFEQLFATKPKELLKDSDTKPTIQLDLPPVMKGDKQFERGYKKKVIRAAAEEGEGDDVTIIDAYRWSIEKSIIVPGKGFVTESIGVGYAWSEWMIGENTLCSKGGVQKEIQEDFNLGDLKERIASQGALIRDLKENQGFGNKDPEVVEAVAELIRLKNLDEE